MSCSGVASARHACATSEKNCVSGGIVSSGWASSISRSSVVPERATPTMNGAGARLGFFGFELRLKGDRTAGAVWQTLFGILAAVRIGIVSYWFNRGQAVVSRQVRSALDSLGHETFVLARPTTDTNIRASFVDRTDVWDQPGITEASAYDIPP